MIAATYLSKMIQISSHALCAILIFVTLAMRSNSKAETLEYRVCSANLSCGTTQNIGYPFWGGNRPQFCGHHEFQLLCPSSSDEYASIDIGMPEWGKVLHISASAPKMVIALERFLIPHPICHDTLKHSMLTLTKPFRLSSNYCNISLFYSCPSSVLKNQYESYATYACLYNNGTNGSVFHFLKRSGSNESTVKLCTLKFTVPVLGRNFHELNHGNATLLSVLQKGFELEYELNFTSCSACLNSGGHCGSSSHGSASEFVCHCPAGSHPLLCPESGRSKSNIIGSVTAASALCIFILILLLICSQRTPWISKFIFMWTRVTIENQNVETFLRSCESPGPKRYTYVDIRKMTQSFKDRVGEGGNGHVYKGKLTDGRSVAVKVLKKLDGNGEEFINEVLSISRTNHVNVITLLGFCFEGKKRALIYEFLPNGSLEKYIHNAGSSQALPCETLFSIAVGVAKGLDYLHRGCNTRILHFDIKPHNILLDEKFCPKISDFGLARLFPKELSHMSTLEARGTIGYIAPEVFCRNFGSVTQKSDVYSFGMMVIDMVCGRINISAEVQQSSDLYFSQWIYDQLEVEEEVVLQAIMDNEEKNLRKKMILVSLWCTQTYPSHRPSMNKVIEMLEGTLESLQIPPRPDLSSLSGSVFDSVCIPQLPT